MIFGLLSGLTKLAIGGLGKVGILGRSLIGGSTLSNLAAPTMVSLFGGTLSSLSKYRSKNQQLDNNEIFPDIQTKYGISNFAKQSKEMLSGSISSYGRSLMAANHAGGVMPNYSSDLWNKLSEVWRNYSDDLGTMNFNTAQRNATFSAHRSANQLSLFSNMIKNVFDAYETERSRVPSSRTQERNVI